MAEAHLNGAVNLPTAEHVFRAVAEAAGHTITKIPDGETGERTGWLAAMVPTFRQVPQLESEMIARSYGTGEREEFRIRSGFTADEIEVPSLGLAEMARDSYALFRRLRERGVIEPGIRFQVSLPTVTAGVNPFIAAEHRQEFEPAYARRLRAEVQEITDAIPHEDLAMQWDVAVEMGLVEGVFPSYFDDPFEGSISLLVEQAGWVPADVPLGYHLCYGSGTTADSGGRARHWREPQDTAKLVAVAGALTERSPRPLAWFSMPVPIDRDDHAYFEPLEDLRLSEGAKLHLGLVHYDDGLEGAQRRADVAKRHFPSFGVATECGMRLVPPELVPSVLRVHADVIV